MSPALVSQVVKQLIADGLVHELDQAKSNGGRPAQRLALVRNDARSIGVTIAPDHISFVDVTLDGTVVRSALEPFDASTPTFLGEFVAKARRYLEAAGEAPVLGLGVAVPGIADAQDNGFVDSFTLGWSKAPIGPVTRRELGLPVLVENNVNAVAIAEQLFGVGRTYDSFVTVTIGNSIGAAIVSERAVVRGALGGAGEMAHFPTVLNGDLCTCGNRGCLLTVIGRQALERDARKRGVLTEHARIGTLTRAADAGDEDAQAVYQRAGVTLGRTVATIVQMLDPEAVVVVGDGTDAWRHWEEGFEPAFRGALLPSRRGIPVSVERWTHERWAQGAACLLLATPFDLAGHTGEQGDLIRSRLASVRSSSA